MQIVRTSEELAAASGRWGRERRLALIPTMGALHDGHLSLVREGRNRADQVAASIFINPLQFGRDEDLGRYPRREEEDARLLRKAGCDLLWIPKIADIYPEGYATTVKVAGVSDRWEGKARSGHFDGVATIVAKLLIAAQPDVAIFGAKDFQQLIVIRRMVADLALPAEILGMPTVREADGLAMSSRNAYLSPDERRRAVALPRELTSAVQAIRSGSPVADVLENARSTLLSGGFASVDYVALVDGLTLDPLDRPAPDARLIAAATIGSTRLIDNLAI